MGSHDLYLIRHGQQAAPDHPPGPLGNGLTARGRQQARRLARRLAVEFADTAPPVIHHSTMRRAAETAAFIAAALPGAPRRGVRALWEIPAVDVPPTFAAWFTRFTPAQIAAGQAQAERAYQRFFRPARGPDKRTLLVCHGNLIRYFITRGLDLPAGVWLKYETHNGGLTRVVIQADGRFELLSWNDLGHLPPALRTGI